MSNTKYPTSGKTVLILAHRFQERQKNRTCGPCRLLICVSAVSAVNQDRFGKHPDPFDNAVSRRGIFAFGIIAQMVLQHRKIAVSGKPGHPVILHAVIQYGE